MGQACFHATVVGCSIKCPPAIIFNSTFPSINLSRLVGAGGHGVASAYGMADLQCSRYANHSYLQLSHPQDTLRCHTTIFETMITHMPAPCLTDIGTS